MIKWEDIYLYTYKVSLCPGIINWDNTLFGQSDMIFWMILLEQHVAMFGPDTCWLAQIGATSWMTQKIKHITQNTRNYNRPLIISQEILTIYIIFVATPSFYIDDSWVLISRRPNDPDARQ